MQFPLVVSAAYVSTRASLRPLYTTALGRIARRPWASLQQYASAAGGGAARGGAAGSGGVALGTPAQVNGQCLTLDAGAALLGVDTDQTVGLGIELLFQGDDDALEVAVGSLADVRADLFHVDVVSLFLKLQGFSEMIHNGAHIQPYVLQPLHVGQSYHFSVFDVRGVY